MNSNILNINKNNGCSNNEKLFVEWISNFQCKLKKIYFENKNINEDIDINDSLLPKEYFDSVNEFLLLSDIYIKECSETDKLLLKIAEKKLLKNIVKQDLMCELSSISSAIRDNNNNLIVEEYNLDTLPEFYNIDDISPIINVIKEENVNKIEFFSENINGVNIYRREQGRAKWNHISYDTCSPYIDNEKFNDNIVLEYKVIGVIDGIEVGKESKIAEIGCFALSM